MVLHLGKLHTFTRNEHIEQLSLGRRLHRYQLILGRRLPVIIVGIIGISRNMNETKFGFVYENCEYQVRTKDDDLGCDVEVNMFNVLVKKQSRPVKLSLARKLLNLITSSTTSESDMHNTYSFREHPMFSSTFNHEQSMCNSYFNQEQIMYNLDPLINEILNEFHPYVTNIQNVMGDGNCGFCAIVVCLGYSEDNWHQIGLELQNELLAYPTEYTNFLLRAVVIAFVGGNHYVKVDLQGTYLMPTILSLWHYNRSSRFARWETLYVARLNSYISPFATHSNCNNSTVIRVCYISSSDQDSLELPLELKILKTYNLIRVFHITKVNSCGGDCVKMN
uniref:OTU domain-containing protein n=1 Tax=Lactuca sativa TaxID=4236 RepID=A0A9R1ULL1_LACSA|nr:hypothetical protein LSAT_V11C800413340 [Lactuca sativa]